MISNPRETRTRTWKRVIWKTELASWASSCCKSNVRTKTLICTILNDCDYYYCYYHLFRMNLCTFPPKEKKKTQKKPTFCMMAQVFILMYIFLFFYLLAIQLWCFSAQRGCKEWFHELLLAVYKHSKPLKKKKRSAVSESIW